VCPSTRLGRLALAEAAEDDKTSGEGAAAARAPAPQGRGEVTISCTHFWRLRGQHFGKEYRVLHGGQQPNWLIRAREIAVRRYQKEFAPSNGLAQDIFTGGYSNREALIEIETHYGRLPDRDFERATQYLDEQFPNFSGRR
jgi:hypothetical protein